MEGYDFCFACELEFGTGYPELGIPVPLVIVYLISYLKFTRKTCELSVATTANTTTYYMNMLQNKYQE